MNRRRHDLPTIAGTFEGLRSDYNAAKSSRYRRQRTGVPSAGSSADWHYRNEGDYLRLMELARDMDRNDLVIGQGIDRAVTNVVQDGFRLDPTTPDQALNADLLARWQEWASDPAACDIQARSTFHALSWQALRHAYVDGDIIPLLTDEGAVELVEGHRLRTPRSTTRNVVHGVLLDSHRRAIEYWLTKDDIDPSRAVERVADMIAYPARDSAGNQLVLHVFNPKRVTQTRGVTAFAPLFDTAAMIEDINFAKLVQQQVTSFFAILRTYPAQAPPLYSDPIKGERTTETLAGGVSRVTEGIAPGMEYIGEPGEQISGFSPNVPNQEFFQHIQLELQLVAVNLGLPLSLFLLDARDTNFSGWRGAVDQARLGFRFNQGWLRDKLHAPVYRWKLRQWMAGDRALRAAAERLGKAFSAHVWNLPAWPYIEPYKDAQADDLRLSRCLISPRRQQAERGLDWDQTLEEIVQDRAALVRRAAAESAAINSEFPEAKVDWRELVGMEIKVTAKAVVQGADADDETEEDRNADDANQ